MRAGSLIGRRQIELVILNPNSSATVTAGLALHAGSLAAPSTHVVALAPGGGPSAVEGWRDAYRSAVGMLDRIESYPGPVDALILAGFGDVGLEALREALKVPVVDITEAGASAAMALAPEYGVVTTIDTMVAPIRSRLRLASLEQRCTGVLPVGVGIADSEDPDLVIPALVRGIAELVERGAGAVCLGSAVFGPYVELVRDRAAVPVIDPVAVAIRIAELSAVPARGFGGARSRMA